MRGPLAPPQVPLNRTRAERFDDLVLDAIDYLDKRWAAELATVEFAVEDVPPVDARHGADQASGAPVPLSGLFRAAPGTAPRIVLYRRPLETRSSTEDALGALVYEVLVDEVAELLGVEPEIIDPSLGDGGAEPT